MTEIPSAEEWATWLKARRAELGLTQARVAMLTDSSLRTVLGWERGEFKPKPATRAGHARRPYVMNAWLTF